MDSAVGELVKPAMVEVPSLGDAEGGHAKSIIMEGNGGDSEDEENVFDQLDKMMKVGAVRT